MEAADLILIGTVNSITEHQQYDEYIVDVENVFKGEIDDKIKFLKKFILGLLCTFILTGCATDKPSEADIAANAEGVYYPEIPKNYLKYI